MSGEGRAATLAVRVCPSWKRRCAPASRTLKSCVAAKARLAAPGAPHAEDHVVLLDQLHPSLHALADLPAQRALSAGAAAGWLAPAAPDACAGIRLWSGPRCGAHEPASSQHPPAASSQQPGSAGSLRRAPGRRRRRLASSGWWCGARLPPGARPQPAQQGPAAEVHNAVLLVHVQHARLHRAAHSGLHTPSLEATACRHLLGAGFGV